MIKNYKNIALLACLSGVATLTHPVLAQEETAPAADSASAIETFGWMVAQQSVVQMEFNDEEMETFLKGFRNGAANPASPATKQQELQAMSEYLQGRMGEINDRKKMAEGKKNAEFLASLEGKEGIQKSDSGLFYEIIEPGGETKATGSDTVTLHYTGTLTDGTVFDSSVERGEPATFSVSGVVPGFAEGVQLVGEGGKVKLYIPPALGYGDNVQPGGPIPPNATLVFDVEMIKINP